MMGEIQLKFENEILCNNFIIHNKRRSTKEDILVNRRRNSTNSTNGLTFNSMAAS